MNLILDIGNTFCKICVFEYNNLIFKNIVKSKKDEIITEVSKIFGDYEIKNVIFSSVNTLIDGIKEFLEAFCGSVLEFSSKTKVPVKNLYSNPAALGLDRLAAAVGAATEFEGKSCLIIDAGTAITFDYLKDGKEFWGGNISPGIRLRFKSLNEHTAKLPLIENYDWLSGFARDTASAVMGGVLNGIKFEIEGYIRDFERDNPDGKIILTGGDTIFLAKNLKNTIFAAPNLVAFGLNRILNYNVSKSF
ncbi:MAG: type III pantothenate kinase [Bacteroidales bacterium]|nr:type III pantothenate kinase [Bacteroidales bacterium]